MAIPESVESRVSGGRQGIFEGDPGPAPKRRRLSTQNPATTSTKNSGGGSGENQYANEIPEHTMEDATTMEVDDHSALSEECCFGGLYGIPVNIGYIHRASPNDRCCVFYAQNTNTLHSEAQYVPIQFPKPIRPLEDLQKLGAISGDLFCRKQHVLGWEDYSGERLEFGLPPLWLLGIVLFGPSGWGEYIGKYLSCKKMFLLPPFECNRHVPFRNPHHDPPESGEEVMANSFQPQERKAKSAI